MTPIITTEPMFERISSPMGNVGSPFDKALAMRNKIVAGYIKKINRTPYSNLPSGIGGGVLSDLWGDESIANVVAVFPNMGNFGPGGGPLS